MSIAEGVDRIIQLQHEHIRRLENHSRVLTKTLATAYGLVEATHAEIAKADALARRGKRREVLKIISILASVPPPPMPTITLPSMPDTDSVLAVLKEAKNV